MDDSHRTTDRPLPVIGTVTVRLDERDRSALAGELADRLVELIRPIFFGRELGGDLLGSGIRVLSVSEAARLLGMTQGQLRRREKQGGLPKRRKISERRVVYYWHEIQGIPANLVRVRDYRQLRQDEVAKKIGVGRATIERMAKNGGLPPKFDDRHWYERDIDDWLLRRPQVQD